MTNAAQALEPLAVIIDYSDYVDAMRARADQLAITRTTIDDVAGLPDRYAAKLLCRPPIKRIGPLSMGVLHRTLGVKLLLVEDLELLARVQHRLVRRLRPVREQKVLASC